MSLNVSVPEWKYVPINSSAGRVLLAMTLAGVATNVSALLLTVIVVRKGMRRVDAFVLTLVLIDFYGILGCTIPTHLVYMTSRWVGGDAMCSWQGFNLLFCSLCSGLLATVVSLDRLWALSWPIAYRTMAARGWGTFLPVGVAILSSVVFSSLPWFGVSRFIKNLTGTYCTVDWFAKDHLGQAYVTAYAVFGISLAVLVTSCNVGVVIAAYRSRHFFKGQAQENSTKTQREKDITVLMLSISFLFLICWIPYMVRIMMNLQGVRSHAWLDVNVIRLLLTNFIVDPLIYVFVRRPMRERLVRMLLAATRYLPLSLRTMRKRSDVSRTTVLTSSSIVTSAPDMTLTSV